MPRIVKQSIVLPAPAKDLYAMYLNPRTHAARFCDARSVSKSK